MTGSTQVLVAGGGGVALPAVVLLHSFTGTTPQGPSLQFFTNGTASASGSGSSCVPGYWHSLPNPNIGNQYWAKMVVNSGAPADGLNGTIVALSATATWVWTQSAVGSKTANATVTVYADAAATIALGSTTFNVTATRTS